ncbi:PIH1 domain-containing protein 2 [Neolamprologus brichardi]|uniref:PIH1 domain-containing protein 2 n=1 Tax=Neolamprologus brichardi TaxID=32507 RepID=UPI001643964F|nr:PIH1 domain-containing protein 2 [Neolamprologus brichardi]
MCSTGSTEDVLQQMSKLWSMLDDLSENDPAAYRTLIEKQMKEGAEFRAPPELDTCLCTEILKPKKGLLYINICGWKRVPAPQDSSRPLPVYTGKLETGTNEDQGWYTVLDVALNPVLLQESRENKAEINQVYMLALSFAQKQLGMTLSQEYRVVNSSPNSSPDELHRRLGFQKLSSAPKQPNTGNLSMSKDDVLLEVEDLYYLLVDFPKTVNEDTASAIFNKKKRRLTLKVNVL